MNCDLLMMCGERMCDEEGKTGEGSRPGVMNWRER